MILLFKFAFSLFWLELRESLLQLQENYITSILGGIQVSLILLFHWMKWICYLHLLFIAKATQASDRVHRIGQERDVEIVHLHMANTIEDSIHELQEKKKAVASAVMGEGKVTEGMFILFYLFSFCYFILFCACGPLLLRELQCSIHYVSKFIIFF